MKAQDVLTFWFDELTPQQWFSSDPKLDELIKEKFSDLHQAAVKGELADWRCTSKGRLAEIIILDQFSRNIYRDTPQAFAADGQAIILAQEMVLLDMDSEIPIEKRAFAYMPFMHSESLTIHEQALKLFQHPGMENNLDFEKKHQAIIAQFGRYPHRNKILQRPSTPEEIEFLKTNPGF